MAGCCKKLPSGWPGALQATPRSHQRRILPKAMIRAAKAHGQDEERFAQADPGWPNWHAEYMVREQSG